MKLPFIAALQGEDTGVRRHQPDRLGLSFDVRSHVETRQDTYKAVWRMEARVATLYTVDLLAARQSNETADRIRVRTEQICRGDIARFIYEPIYSELLQARSDLIAEGVTHGPAFDRLIEVLDSLSAAFQGRGLK